MKYDAVFTVNLDDNTEHDITYASCSLVMLWDILNDLIAPEHVSSIVVTIAKEKP